jgi:hypothetical protein
VDANATRRRAKMRAFVTVAEGRAFRACSTTSQ